jgi:hypothetical protein
MKRLATALILAACSATTALAGDYGPWSEGSGYSPYNGGYSRYNGNGYNGHHHRHGYGRYDGNGYGYNGDRYRYGYNGHRYGNGHHHHGYGGYSYRSPEYFEGAYTTYVSPLRTVAVTEDYPWYRNGYGPSFGNGGYDDDDSRYGGYNGYRSYRTYHRPHYDDGYRHSGYSNGHGYRYGNGYGYGNGHGYRSYSKPTCVVYNRRGVQVVVRSRGGC